MKTNLEISIHLKPSVLDVKRVFKGFKPGVQMSIMGMIKHDNTRTFSNIICSVTPNKTKLGVGKAEMVECLGGVAIFSYFQSF